MKEIFTNDIKDLRKKGKDTRRWVGRRFKIGTQIKFIKHGEGECITKLTKITEEDGFDIHHFELLEFIPWDKVENNNY